MPRENGVTKFYFVENGKFEFYGGIYENNNIQNMAMHLGNITNTPRIDYVYNAF